MEVKNEILQLLKVDRENSLKGIQCLGEVIMALEEGKFEEIKEIYDANGLNLPSSSYYNGEWNDNFIEDCTKVINELVSASDELQGTIQKSVYKTKVCRINFLKGRDNSFDHLTWLKEQIESSVYSNNSNYSHYLWLLKLINSVEGEVIKKRSIELKGGI